MFDRLPDTVDPARLAVQGREINGFLPVGEMPRLAAALADTEGQATARFVFSRAPGQPERLRGHVEAGLRIQCQRCLEPMDLPVSHDFEVRLVLAGVDPDTVPSDEDAVWVGADGLSLHTLLEDELLLSLPVVALHETGSACADAGLREFAPSDLDKARQEDEQNPFAVLKSLKGNKE